ncbi:hypothetical protein ABZ552_08000 [Nocardia sp. NPDC019219]|uniref:hypothetical protein n=1 Tax=Nocardia sp. NPDC019219 TaxID=3154590 RepID=UPI0033DC4782
MPRPGRSWCTDRRAPSSPLVAFGVDEHDVAAMVAVDDDSDQVIAHDGADRDEVPVSCHEGIERYGDRWMAQCVHWLCPSGRGQQIAEMVALSS